MARALNRYATGIEEIDVFEFAAESFEVVKDEHDQQHVSFLEWALRVPEPKTGTLNFAKFPFQVELYESFADQRDGIIKKGTQCGISAWLLRWLMYWTDTRGLTSLYVQPKAGFLSDFSNQRVKPLIQKSDYLAGRVPESHINNVYQRQIGLGWLNMRGSQTEDSLIAVDADCLGLDEYDQLVQANVPEAERRVSGPLSKGLIRRVGVPSIPSFGIAKLFEESDQRNWMVTCPKCHLVQRIDYYRSSDDPVGYVDEKRKMIVCAECTSPLDVAAGEWVAKYPDRDRRGYHVTRMLVPDLRLDDMIAASKKRDPFEVQKFHNNDRGMEFAPKEGRLDDAALAAAMREYAMAPGYAGANVTVMGIDVASVRNLNVWINEHLPDGKRRALWIGECESFDDVASLMDIFDVKMAAIDHLPEGRLARGLAQRFRGRMIVVHYNSNALQKDALQVDEDFFEASLKRTEAHDTVIALVRAQRQLLPINPPEGFGDHMKAPVRFIEKDDVGRVVVGYRATGPDDYFQAGVYCMTAWVAWLIRQEVSAASEETFSVLDDHLEFRRSEVASYGSGEYRPGPDDEYRPGPGGEDAFGGAPVDEGGTGW